MKNGKVIVTNSDDLETKLFLQINNTLRIGNNGREVKDRLRNLRLIIENELNGLMPKLVEYRIDYQNGLNVVFNVKNGTGIDYRGVKAIAKQIYKKYKRSVGRQ